MKITRFAQSCLLIEIGGKKILIDPGVIKFDESYLEKEWLGIDFILITHKHADHCNVVVIEKIVEKNNSIIFSSKEVSESFPSLNINIVKEKDVVNLKYFKIEVVKAIHGWIPVLKGGKEIFENIGFIIDDGKNRLYHTSDTICFENNYECDFLFVPVGNHGLVMGPFEAALFSKEVNAKIVFPFHYDNPSYSINLLDVKKEFDKQKINYVFLDIGEIFEQK